MTLASHRLDRKYGIVFVGDGVVIVTNSGGGLDSVVPGRDGHKAAKVIARKVLGIDGAWDLSGK